MATGAKIRNSLWTTSLINYFVLFRIFHGLLLKLLKSFQSIAQNGCRIWKNRDNFKRHIPWNHYLTLQECSTKNVKIFPAHCLSWPPELNNTEKKLLKDISSETTERAFCRCCSMVLVHCIRFCYGLYHGPLSIMHACLRTCVKVLTNGAQIRSLGLLFFSSCYG